MLERKRYNIPHVRSMEQGKKRVFSAGFKLHEQLLLAFLADNVGMWEWFFFCAKPLLEKIPGGEGTAVYGLYRYVPL